MWVKYNVTLYYFFGCCYSLTYFFGCWRTWTRIELPGFLVNYQNNIYKCKIYNAVWKPCVQSNVLKSVTIFYSSHVMTSAMFSLELPFILISQAPFTNNRSYTHHITFSKKLTQHFLLPCLRSMIQLSIIILYYFSFINEGTYLHCYTARSGGMLEKRIFNITRNLG